MKLIATILLLLQVVFSQTITTCQQENYLAVIGGSSYTVNSVYTAINSDQSTIAVCGLLTQSISSTPIAYFYLVSSKSCQLMIQNQFPAYKNGIQAITFSQDNNQVAMVAYSANAEFLIVVETTSATYETWIYETGTLQDVVRTLSLLAVGYDEYFIVGAKQIRKVFAGGNQAEVATGAIFSSLNFNTPAIKCATKTSSAIYALLQIDGSQSMILTKLDYQLNVLNSYSTKNGVSATWTDNEARISNAVGPPTTTAVSVCVNGLTGKVQFTMYISDDPTHAVILSQTYKTSSWAQCLGVRAKDGQNADYILINAALTLWWYSINFGTGTLQSRLTLTPALTGWQSDRRSNAVLGQGFTLISGLVSQILGITKGYNLGFVRVNEDVQWSTSVPSQLFPDILATDPTPVLGQGPTVTQTYTSTTVNFKQVLAPTVNKSDWTKDFCPNIQNVQQGTSSCFFYTIYENPQAVSLLETSRMWVPKEACLCPQTNLDQLDISLTLQPIRQVCFPYLSKQPKSIPYDNASGKYLVQQNGAFWNWPRSIQKALAKQSASIVYLTDTDDKVNFPGDHFSMKFVGQLVANKVIKITRGKNFKQTVVIPSKRMKNQQFTFQITCLSKTCPGKFLIRNDTMIADSSDICGSELNKSYIYMVEIHYTVQNFSEFSTITFNFTCPKQKSPININLPWAQWVELNGKSSKYRPTPLTKDQQVTATQSAQEISSSDIASLLSDASPEAQRVVSKWTNEQVFTAVAEAKARKEKIAKQIMFSAKIGNQGNLRLSFSNPVAMPSYLTFDSKPELSMLQVSQNQTNPSDATANSRRRRRMKCAGGVCPQLNSQLNNPVDASADDCSGGDCQAIDCQGADCQAPDCSGGDCQATDCQGADCQAPQALDCSSGDCQATNCQGADCQAPQALDCSGEDCQAADCQGADCQSPQALDCSSGDCQAADCSGADCQAADQSDQASSLAYQAEIGAQTPVDVGLSGCNEQSQDQIDGDNTCTQEDKQEVPILDSLDCSLSENRDAVDCGGSDPTICPFGSYFDNQKNACKRYVIYFGEWKDLFKIEILPDPNKDPATAQKDLAHTFHVTAATVNYIDIYIDFVNPLKVTVRDKVQFELKFNEIEPALPGVSSSRRLFANPGLTQFTAQLTPQVPKGGAQKLETAAASVQAATIGAVVGSAVLQILLSGALAQIWGMINGIQIIIYLPLLAIQFPANALMMIDKILIVACFDIPYLDMEDIYGDYWVAGDDVSIFNDLPNNDLLTSGLGSLGFSSRMLSANLGSVFIFMTLSFALLAFIGVLEILQRSGKFETFRKAIQLESNSSTLAQSVTNSSELTQPTTNTLAAQPIQVQPIFSIQKSQRKSGNRGYRLLKWLKRKFLWNYFIRLFFECCLELIIATWLGVKYGHFWNTDFPVPVTAATVICFGLSLWWFIVVAGLPIFIITFYLYNWKKVRDETFESKFNCVYEGLKTESKLALIYPTFFVVRRCCLMITVIVFYQFIWLQIVVQLFFCFFIILFVYMKWPFEDDTQNKLEIMNEVTTVVLLYIVYMFSDLIPDPETQYTVGYFYIVILISNLSVHLTLIGISIFKELVQKIKGWHQACKKKKEKQKGIVQVKDVDCDLEKGQKKNIQKFKSGKIRLRHSASSEEEEARPQETELGREVDKAAKIAEEKKVDENRQLKEQEIEKNVEEIKKKNLKDEDRNVRYLQRQFQTEDNFDASQGLCCNWFRNRKGVRAIIVIDMILCFNIVRLIFALKAYNNMGDHFRIYAKVRLVTFWMQAIWLTLNLGVCIYINIWGDSTLNSMQIFSAVLFVVLVVGIDFHYMQCVLFLNNHIERLNQKASGDEKNVRYAYQMDPTAPENIEEQQEIQKLKLSQEKEIANKLQDDTTARFEGQSTTLIQEEIATSVLVTKRDLSSSQDSIYSSSQDSESDSYYSEKISNSQIIVDQEQQEQATFRLVKWQGTRIENDNVMTEMMFETQEVPLTDLSEIHNSIFLRKHDYQLENSNSIQQGMSGNVQKEKQFIAEDFDFKIQTNPTIIEEVKDNLRSRKAVFNGFVAGWKESSDPALRKVANKILFKDFADLLPDDFTDESDDYQENTISNLLEVFSEQFSKQNSKQIPIRQLDTEQQNDIEEEFTNYYQKLMVFQIDIPSPFPRVGKVKRNKMMSQEMNKVDSVQKNIDSSALTRRTEKPYRSCLDDSDQEGM